MAIPQIVTKTLITANNTLIAASQTPVSGTLMTLNTSNTASSTTTQPNATGFPLGYPRTIPVGANVGYPYLGSVVTTYVKLDTPRRVQLIYGSEAAARTLTVYGTNQFGININEVLAVPSTGAGTIATAQDFLTVTSLLPLGGGWTAAASVGTNTTGSSPWMAVSYMVTPVNLGVNCVVTGTVTYSIEYTNDNPNNPNNLDAGGTASGYNTTIPTAFQLASLNQSTINSSGVITQPFTFWRLTINSGQGSVTATGIPAGIRQ